MTEKPWPPGHLPNPPLVEVTRGPMVESVHRGAVAVCTRTGELVAAWGDVERAVFPRSAIKAVQALPLIETGAADRYGLSDRELALACASHSGEPGHVEAIEAWLSRIGLTEADFECGSHPPMEPSAARALVVQGRQPTPIHNNCSGKHCGMLTTARHLGEPTANYISAHHPVQRRVAQALGEMADCSPHFTPFGTDGCGIPTFALPLSGIATAMARLADPEGLGAARADAARRLIGAMTACPDLVAGSTRLCSQIMRAVPSLAVKGGAEGVYTAVLPGKGWGVALKIDDGAGRAAEVAILAVLKHLGQLSASQEATLRARAVPQVLNVAGVAVGTMRPSPEWLG